MSEEISISMHVARVESLYNRVLTRHRDVTTRAWDASSGQASANSGGQVTDTGRKRLMGWRICPSQLPISN